MSDLYANCAAALRAMLPRLAEPDQQVVAAAALSLDHAARTQALHDYAKTPVAKMPLYATEVTS